MGYQIIDIDGATQAPGSAVPSRGVQALGSDGTNSRALLVDASGRPLVVGPGAPGAAPVGNPLYVAGQDGTNLRALRTDTSGRPHAVLHDGAGNTISSILDGSTRRLSAEVAIAPGQSVSVGSPIPENPTNIVRDTLKNAGSADLRVDGSSTAVAFTFPKDGTDDIKIGELRFVMVADSILFEGAKFGPINQLTNGLLVEVTSDDTTVTLATLTLSEHFLSFPNPQLFFDRGGPKEVLSASFGLGGAVKLLAASTGDEVKITVRDDLTNVKFQHFQCTLAGVKV